MAKLVSVFVLFLSLSAHADTIYQCTEAAHPLMTYTLKGKGDYPAKFVLTVKEGDQIVATDKVRFTDVQGVYVFQSKSTYIEMESLEEVSYDRTGKNSAGAVESVHADLVCTEK